MSENVSQSGSLKVGVVSGGFGVNGSFGFAKGRLGASGPEVSTTITSGEKVSAAGSVATVGAEETVSGAGVGGNVTFGSVRFGQGKLDSKIVSTGSDATVSKESNGTKKEISSNGEVSIGASIGMVTATIAVAPMEAVQAVKNGFEMFGNFIKEGVKNLIPSFLGGNKDVK